MMLQHLIQSLLHVPVLGAEHRALRHVKDLATWGAV